MNETLLRVLVIIILIIVIVGLTVVTVVEIAKKNGLVISQESISGKISGGQLPANIPLRTGGCG